MQVTELDLLELLTDITVEVLVAAVLGIGGALWAWLRWGPNKRRDLTTPDRHELSIKFGAAARQLEMLGLYDQQLHVSADVDDLWPKIQRCLDNLMEIGHGSAAKIATGNSAAGLSKPEGTIAMLVVGAISTLATGYAQNLQQRLAGVESSSGEIPKSHLEMKAWADLFWFAEKVFNPTKWRFFALRRLERCLQRRMRETYEASQIDQSQAPPDLR